MACQLQHILNPLDEQDMSAVKILHDMTNATHTTTAPSDTTMALTPAVDGHDNSQATEVDANVHIAATILMRLSNTPQARLQPIYVIPGTDLESEPHPEESEKRVNAWMSDGSLIPIIASRRSAIFKLAKGRIVEGERVCESVSESEEEVDDDATIDNEEAVREREQDIARHHLSLSLPSSPSPSLSPSSSSSPPPTAIPTIIITPPTSSTPSPPTPTPTSLALSATSKRKAKRTPIDGSTIDTPSVRKRKAKPTPPEEHGQDTHTTSAGPSPNKKRKTSASALIYASTAPASVYAPITPPVKPFAAGDGAGVGEKEKSKGGRSQGLGLDGGYWDLRAVAKRIVEGREKGGEVKVSGEMKVEGGGARRSGRVTRKSVRFAL
ncbi:MAG: hypothetical protein Q9204_007770 [Flavoplaca sp. TL-2023a]